MRVNNRSHQNFALGSNLTFAATALRPHQIYFLDLQHFQQKGAPEGAPFLSLYLMAVQTSWNFPVAGS